MLSCDKVVFLTSRCTTVLEILNLKRFALHNRWQPESMLMFFGSVSDVMVFFFSLKLPSAGGKAVPRKRNQIWMQQDSHSDRGSLPDATGPNRKQPHRVHYDNCIIKSLHKGKKKKKNLFNT